MERVFLKSTNQPNQKKAICLRPNAMAPTTCNSISPFFSPDERLETGKFTKWLGEFRSVPNGKEYHLGIASPGGGAFHSTKNSGNSRWGSEWNRHFPEFQSEVQGALTIRPKIPGRISVNFHGQMVQSYSSVEDDNYSHGIFQ